MFPELFVKIWLLIMKIATTMLMEMTVPLLRAHGVPKSQLKIPAEEKDIEIQAEKDIEIQAERDIEVQAELEGEMTEEPGVEVGLEVTEGQGVGVGE